MQFKDLESHNLCAQCFTGLDKTSYDSSNQVTMCAAKHRAINFDALMELYAKLHKISLPSSADAFLCVGEDEGLLIEFKNGFVDKSAARQIAKKAYDSILILS